MKKKNLKKLLKYAMLFAMIILVVLLIILNRLKAQNQNKEIIKPMFMDSFFNEYKGSLSKDYILTSLTDFTDYIIDNIGNIDEDNVNEKYLRNKNYLKSIGFSTEQDFEKIMMNMKNIDNKSVKLSYTAFEMDTIKTTKDETSIVFTLKLVGIDEIKFNLTMENSKNNAIKISI